MEFRRVLFRSPSPDGDDEGRRFVGVRVDEKNLRGFPTPSGRLEFYSKTLADWGWHEYAIPAYIKSHVHPDKLNPDPHFVISTFRLVGVELMRWERKRTA